MFNVLEVCVSKLHFWKEKMPKKIVRFPRLILSSLMLKNGARVLMRTWNQISKDKGRRVFYAQSKAFHRESHLIYVLVDLLMSKKIPLDTYLRIMSLYGGFGKNQTMPGLKFLISDRAIAVYGWLYEKEKSKYPLETQWKNFLLAPNGKGDDIDERKILKEILSSAKEVRLFKTLHRLDIGSAAIMKRTELSPWFLGICVPFLKMGGLDILEYEFDGEESTAVKHAIRYYLRHKSFFKKVRHKLDR